MTCVPKKVLGDMIVEGGAENCDADTKKPKPYTGNVNSKIGKVRHKKLRQGQRKYQ